jgi:hypothetical protein
MREDGPDAPGDIHQLTATAEPVISAHAGPAAFVAAGQRYRRARKRRAAASGAGVEEDGVRTVLVMLLLSGFGLSALGESLYLGTGFYDYQSTDDPDAYDNMWMHMWSSTDGITFTQCVEPAQLNDIDGDNGVSREPDVIQWHDNDGSPIFLALWDDYPNTYYCISKAKNLTGPWERIATIDMSVYVAHVPTKGPQVWSPQFFVDPRDNSLHVLASLDTGSGYGEAPKAFHMEPRNPADLTTWGDLNGWKAPIEIPGLGTDAKYVFDIFLVRANDGYYYGAYVRKEFVGWWDPTYLGFVKSVSTTDPFAGYTVITTGNMFAPLEWLEGCCLVKVSDEGPLGRWRVYFDHLFFEGNYYSESSDFVNWSAPARTTFLPPELYGPASHIAIRRVDVTLPPGAPSFSPEGGIYGAPQSVTVTFPVTGSTIRYTTNGIDPNESDAEVASGGRVAVDHTMTLKARTWAADGTQGVVASADYYVISRSGYSGGSGTSGEPYVIANSDDLAELAISPDDYDKSFVMTEDISVAAFSLTKALISPDANSAVAGFQGAAFTGTFDGNGHCVTGLSIDDRHAGNDFLGLFGQVCAPGVVRRLTVKDCVIAGSTGTSQVGGCVAWCNSASIEDCHVSGTVMGGTFAGGLVGRHYYATISGCSSTASVTATGTYAGGLAASNSTGSIISQSWAGGNVAAGSSGGGLVGCCGGTIVDCYAMGRVAGPGSRYGGLTGENYGGIRRCYSTGSVYCQGDGGGLNGWLGEKATVTASFWDMEASDSWSSCGGTGLYSSQMTESGVFTSAGWDFAGERANGTADIWHMPYCESGYPMLWWQRDIPGDVAGRYGVEFADLAVMAGQWGQIGAGLAGDFSESGMVWTDDLMTLCEYWLAGM